MLAGGLLFLVFSLTQAGQPGRLLRSKAQRNLATPDITCPITEQTCMEETVMPFINQAHDDSVSNEDKDKATEAFCATPCGAGYTDHAVAVIRGFCDQDTASDIARHGMRLCSRIRFDNIIDCAIDWFDDVFGGSHHRHHEEEDDGRRPAHHDEDEEEENQGEEDQGIQNDDDRDEEPEDEGAPASTHNNNDAFKNDRPGTALGCMKDKVGDLCANKMGCDFWRSCCAFSWVELSAKGGYSLNDTMVDAINKACPGARTWISGVRGSCT